MTIFGCCPRDQAAWQIVFAGSTAVMKPDNQHCAAPLRALLVPNVKAHKVAGSIVDFRNPKTVGKDTDADRDLHGETTSRFFTDRDIELQDWPPSHQ